MIKKADINARNLLMSNLGDFKLFPKWVSDNLKAGIEYKTAGIILFKIELKAEYFAVSVHEIVEQINASSDIFIDEIHQSN